MTTLITTLRELPARRMLARVIGYGLFGGELVGSVLLGALTIATILGLGRTTIGF